MYEIIKSVIESSRYELSDMLKKIDVMWLQGDVTDEQKNELVELARDKAIPENSYASLQVQVDKIIQKQTDFEKRLYKLEHPTEPEPPTEEYPEYAQPTSAHDAYHNGDKVTYKGEKYECIAPEGTAVVWSPDDMPSYWQKVETVTN